MTTIAYTYDNSEQEFFNNVYDILNTETGASETFRESFVTHFTRNEHRAVEWRIGLGGRFPGKFYRNDNRFYISAYGEVASARTRRTEEVVNGKLLELQKKYKPRAH